MSVDEIYNLKAPTNTQKTVRQMVEEKFQLARPKLDDAELAVMEDLRIATSPITQAYIARSRPFLGAHPHWEENKPTQETTHRRVRAIINGLRVNHHIAILADRRGYWLARDLGEAEIFLDDMEREARASAKSYMVTFHAMSKAIDGLRPRDTTSLFDFGMSFFDLAEEANTPGRLAGPIAPPPGFPQGSSDR